ncbi:MAG: family 2 glycosyl transferase [Parcubacteria group bacterium Gr01-1014_2]|nr:MAG: family 2 glycosyl transferase [Parcubacteria group bacterium Gr01-1014_2]
MNGKEKNNPKISIIIPVKNEGASLPILYEKIADIYKESFQNNEIIFINDGSTDNTQSVIEKLHSKDARVKAVQLRRNFGQTAAISAGFDIAQGEIIITMDADLQNDPADIPRLLDKINEGYDIVSGWRKNRKDKFLTRRLPSRIANFIISKLTGVYLHDYGCALKAYRKEALNGIRLYGDMHRFIPIFPSSQGFKVTEIAVIHHPRKFGKSKYGISRILKVIIDIATIQFFIKFLTKPMRLFGTLGIFFATAGLGINIYLTYLKLFQGLSISGRPLLLLGISLIIAGIQIASLGILGEVISRIYFESQNKKTYTVRKILR